MTKTTLSLTALALVTIPRAQAARPPQPMLEVTAKLPQALRLGEPMPEFEAVSNRGPIHFPDDYRGKWLVFFSHPADFTPVCTSEFVLFAAAAKELRARNTELLGLSVGTVAQHDAWVKTIRDEIEFAGHRGQVVGFPIIADLGGELAWQLGMIHPEVTTNHTVRTVFIVDPRGKIRSILQYPEEVGRSIAEIKRLVVALQTSDEHDVFAPAEWRPGQAVLARPAMGSGAAVAKAAASARCQAGYFCPRELPAVDAAQ